MAFFQDTRPSREPFLNAPPTVLWLIGALLAAHAARIAIAGSFAQQLIADYALIPARYTGVGLPGEPGIFSSLAAKIASVFTYLFLHADFAHVGLNSLWLLAFGPWVARRLGAGRFLAFFFLCGLGAALAHLAANWGSPVPVIGASGAIAGLMAAGMRMVYGMQRQRYELRPPLAPLTSRPLLTFTAIWVVMNIVVGVTGLGLTNGVTAIAWVAHLGGYFTGLLTVGLFDRRPAPALPVV